MSRKSGSFNVHALLLGIAILAILSGGARWMLTGAGGVGNKTQLAFWNGFTGPDGIVMLQIIEEFNKENPDVEVVMQRIPWAVYYNKLTVAGSDGRGPEIFIVHTDALPRIRRAGFIADVSDLYGPAGIDPEDFDPQVLDMIRFSGDYEGVALDIHPQGLYLNAEMLREAGYVDENGNPRPPKDRAEFLDLIDKSTIEPNAQLRDKQWGFAFTFWGNNFRSLVPQFGGRYLDENGDSVLNSPENLAALKFLADIAKQEKAPPPDNGLGWFGYRTGRVAMVWDGIYMLGDLKRVQDIEYIGAPIPQIGDHYGTLANSHVLCLNTKLNEKEREAAARFVKFLSAHSLEWAEAGQVPARISVRKDPAFKEMQVQSAFAEQIDTMMYPPRTPIIFEFMLEVDRVVELVVRGQMTPEEALKTAQENTQEIIDRDRREFPNQEKL